jgi:hypothetical protein
MIWELELPLKLGLNSLKIYIDVAKIVMRIYNYDDLKKNDKWPQKYETYFCHKEDYENP